VRNVVSLIGLLTLAINCGVQGNVILSDNFNGSAMNPNIWTAGVIGTGPTVQQLNGQLLITLASSTVGGMVAGGYRSAYLISGDMDIQISYQLSADWLPGNGTRVGIGVVDYWNSMQRLSDVYYADGIDAYAYSNPSGGINYVPTDDTAGRLRITRTGSEFKAYYSGAAQTDWTYLGTGQSTSGDIQISISVWNSWFDGNQVTVGLDDFSGTYDRITYFNPVPDPGNVAIVAAVVWGLLIDCGRKSHSKVV
jgi:hypothetical protein